MLNPQVPRKVLPALWQPRLHLPAVLQPLQEAGGPGVQGVQAPGAPGQGVPGPLEEVPPLYWTRGGQARAGGQQQAWYDAHRLWGAHLPQIK